MGQLLSRDRWPLIAIDVSPRPVEERTGQRLRFPRRLTILGAHLFAFPQTGSDDVMASSESDPGPSDPGPVEGRHGGRTRGDHAAFERLFTRHSGALFEYLCGMTRGDRELATDLVQETFLRAYGARVALTDVEHPQAWLFRIATNLALTARRRRPISWVPLGAVEPQPGADSSDRWRLPRDVVERSPDVAALVAERDAIWRVLAELPPRWRTALLLQTTSGFSAREIAALLGLSEANVRKMLFRAKERFRAIYLALEARTGREGGLA